MMCHESAKERRSEPGGTDKPYLSPFHPLHANDFSKRFSIIILFQRCESLEWFVKVRLDGRFLS